jgi:hypothetical protein
MLFRRAREHARRARSLEQRAAKFAQDARREYEYGKRLFLQACAEMAAAEGVDEDAVPAGEPRSLEPPARSIDKTAHLEMREGSDEMTPEAESAEPGGGGP